MGRTIIVDRAIMGVVVMAVVDMGVLCMKVIATGAVATEVIARAEILAATAAGANMNKDTDGYISSMTQDKPFSKCTLGALPMVQTWPTI